MKRSISNRSRLLTKAERVYDTTQREFLAIIWSVPFLRPFLKGPRFTVRTDHDSLRLILKLTDATERPAWWQLRQSEVDFDVVHCASVKHQEPTPYHGYQQDTDNTPLEVELPVLVIASGEKTDDTTTNIFALEAHTSIPAHSVSDADGTDPTPLTLA